MRSVPALVLAVLVLAASCSLAQSNAGKAQASGAANPRPDFSGTWVLDVERSWVEAPGRERLPAETLVVTQTATTLSFDGGDRGFFPNGSIRLDRPLRTTVDGMPLAVDATWNDGELLVASWLGTREVSRATSLRWTISRDGRQLTVEGTRTDRSQVGTGDVARSDASMKRVYRRR
jgi:hypothetical protein